MRGGFDLNGRYYPNADDALNAEIAQCNEIDNRHNQRRLDSYQKDLQRNEQMYSQYIEEIYSQMQLLQEPLRRYYIEQLKHNSL